jgi:hypothetical protein
MPSITHEISGYFPAAPAAISQKRHRRRGNRANVRNRSAAPVGAPRRANVVRKEDKNRQPVQHAAPLLPAERFGEIAAGAEQKRKV